MKTFRKYILAVCFLAAALTARPAAAGDTAAAGAPLRKDLLTAVVVPKWSYYRKSPMDGNRDDRLDRLARDVEQAVEMMRSSLLRRGYKLADDSVMKKIAADWKSQDAEPGADFVRKMSETYGVQQFVAGDLKVLSNSTISTDDPTVARLSVSVIDHTGQTVYSDAADDYYLGSLQDETEAIAVFGAAQRAVEYLTNPFPTTTQARVSVEGRDSRGIMQLVWNACSSVDGVYDAWIDRNVNDGFEFVEVWGDFSAKDLVRAIEENVPCENIQCTGGRSCQVKVTVSLNKNRVKGPSDQ